MTAAEMRPDEPLRFVIARSDVRTDRNGIKSTIRAGQLVRRDDQVVRELPEAFFDSCRYRFFFELTEFNRDSGEYLRKITNSAELDHLPPPGDRSEEHWQRFWESQLRKEGRDPWDVEVERLEGTDYIVRASISRNVPPAPVIQIHVPEQPPPVVNVEVYNPIEPRTAEVQFKRDPAGQIESASIVEDPQDGS